MKTSVLLLLFALPGLTVVRAQQPDKTLWYRQPAQYFEESLVLGNGTQGASVFGGVESDKIFLNDATLWSGEPVRTDMNPDAYKTVPAVREALKNEDYKGADGLNRKLSGNRLKKVTIYSKTGGQPKLISGNKTRTVSLKPGQKVTLTW